MAWFTVACQNEVGKRTIAKDGMADGMGNVGSFAEALFKGTSRWHRTPGTEGRNSGGRQPWHRARAAEAVHTLACTLWDERHCAEAGDDGEDDQAELSGQVGKSIVEHCDACGRSHLGRE